MSVTNLGVRFRRGPDEDSDVAPAISGQTSLESPDRADRTRSNSYGDLPERLPRRSRFDGGIVSIAVPYSSSRKLVESISPGKRRFLVLNLERRTRTS